MLYLIFIAVAVFILNGIRHAENQTGKQYSVPAIICIAAVGYSLMHLYFGYVAA